MGNDLSLRVWGFLQQIARVASLAERQGWETIDEDELSSALESQGLRSVDLRAYVKQEMEVSRG